MIYYLSKHFSSGVKVSTGSFKFPLKQVGRYCITYPPQAPPSYPNMDISGFRTQVDFGGQRPLWPCETPVGKYWNYKRSKVSIADSSDSELKLLMFRSPGLLSWRWGWSIYVWICGFVVSPNTSCFTMWETTGIIHISKVMPSFGGIILREVLPSFGAQTPSSSWIRTNRQLWLWSSSFIICCVFYSNSWSPAVMMELGEWRGQSRCTPSRNRWSLGKSR